MSDGGEDRRSPGSGVPPELDRHPWIESREGLLFFANAVLVAPGLFVLFPLALRALLHPLVLHGRPSVMLDTIPAVAAHVLPAVGWLLLIPLGLTVWNLRVEVRRWPRAALGFFLLVHLAFLTYTVWRWLGG